tara:strand:+ start:201 stop:422 length:222 start_codon:yes stop_codon:yes gene_type:complete
MKSGYCFIGVVIPVVLILAGCVSPHAIMVNSAGEEIECSAKGFGLITGEMAENRFDKCMAEAKASGYRETKVR